MRLAELSPQLIFREMGEDDRHGVWCRGGPLQEMDLGACAALFGEWKDELWVFKRGAVDAGEGGGGEDGA